jgi:hypothetical protein
MKLGSLVSLAASPLPRSATATGAFSALSIVLLTAVCFAQSGYAPLNVPGAVATEARGINNSGEIVGFYKTVACADYDIKVPNCPTRGFKYVNGAYVKLMVPNSVSTAITGVNDLGDLVGFYKKADGTRHGFIWYHTNVVKTIDHPGTALITVPFGINRAGTVVGDSGGLTPPSEHFQTAGGCGSTDHFIRWIRPSRVPAGLVAGQSMALRTAA